MTIKENDTVDDFSKIKDTKERDKRYDEFLKEVTPRHNTMKNCLQAFIVGGIICFAGQVITEFLKMWFAPDVAAAWTTISLIAVSVILTSLNVYPLITKWGGAGSLVPITGFANSVAAAAIEFQKEGRILGIGCKIFVIAGPVILYGILSSWALGIVYYVMKCVGLA